MGNLFGGGQPSYTPPPPPPEPVIQQAPEPAPVPDTEDQKRAALKQAAVDQARMTTRRSTIIGDDGDTLG